ncbi:MAG: DNA polymerase III subunit alpha [Myxococcales bacterium]|nr:DNA polymerase III subunit alpha [Myxococcales bacterium]MCB9580621.1 DNA polymerase III subunit alpha [Polyangiaceae bacterium]
MSAEFVHLHVHTQFSFLVSTVKLAELPARTKELGMSAVALTDRANMYGAIRHWKKCKAIGVRPILGAEVNVAREGGKGVVDHLVLLASNDAGYRNLIDLVSLGYREPASDAGASIRLEDIATRRSGLVGLSGCLGGVAAQAILENGPERGQAMLGKLAEAFDPGSLFVELQDHGLPEQPVVNDLLAKAAKNLDLPLVATNDVHFMKREDGEAQLYLECIRQGRVVQQERENHHGSFEMYLKSPAEMAETFRDLPDAVRNTLRVAEMCSGLELTLDQPMLPRFPVPEGYDVDGYFRHVAEEGLARRFAEFVRVGKKVDESAYRQRLERELEVIVGMKYPGYFLIVWDFIREAKARGIPVGPGRGSGAGSLVAYSMGITEIDPLPYNLLFERFLNPERVSMPDFDVDFCMARRDEVITYVAEKYGRDSVGQIATYQNLKARSVIKDVARAMGIPAPDAQRIASLVPDLGQGKTATVEQALEMEPKLKAMVDSDAQVAELLTQAKKLEGLTRHAGMHAAGVVISDGPLFHHVPIFTSDSHAVTQYDKDDVEAAGLVKFDFLGLKTLTVIDIAQRLVNARPDRKDDPLDLSSIALDDRDTYALISSGDTTGVFQLESSGMQQLLRQLKPDCFEDIVAAVALYRPGPLGTGMIDDFIGGKHGRKPIRKLHPLVDDVLKPTYGVPVYQEQVMQIAQHLAGYSLGGADLLRRAMGKKKAEEMKRQQQIFVDGAKKNDVSEEQALAIFREVEGFASYGFNKSHSAAYALVTYHTAYLKAHYPTEFFAALLTADKDKIEKVVRTIAEARAWGVSVLPPDINASSLDFTVVYAHPDGRGPARGPGKLRDRSGPQIRFGLGAVRGVGEAALESVFEARDAGGPFGDLFDFAGRVDAKRLNKGVFEALVQCGAFDSALTPIGISRARAYAAVDRALERARSASRDRERGQTTLFGMFAAAEQESAATDGDAAKADEYPRCEEWDRLELLRREKASLGCYVSGHPLFRYGNKLERLGAVATIKVAGEQAWSMVNVAGMVEGYRERLFKGGSGGKAAFFELEDAFGRVQAKLRGDRIERFGQLLTGGEPVLVTGKVSFPITDEPEEDPEPTLLVDSVELLSDAVLKATRSLSIRLSSERAARSELEKLRALLEDSPGSCPVELVLSLPDGAEAILALDETRVTPSDRVLSGLERMFGDTVAELR